MRGKKIFKKISAFVLALVIILQIQAPVDADAAWRQDNVGWWWQEDNGGYAANSWELIDGAWYHFNASGYMDTGWVYDGSWYYLDINGAMKTGWIYDGAWYYLDSTGAMLTGWQVIDGYWYYLAEDGRMLSSQWVGNSWVGTNGEWQCTEKDQTYVIDLGNGQTTTVVGHFDVPYATRAVYLLNQHRLANNAPALTEVSVIKSAAELRAYELTYLFDHTRPNGTICFTACDSAYGENIAYGYGTPEAVMKAWTESPGHNENMLDPRYETIGIGVFAETTTYGYRYYWVQLFGIN